MTDAFAWLGELVSWFGQWFPRWEIMDTSEGWVKWVRGKRIVTGGAGIVFYWPATTKFARWFVARDSKNCKAQTLSLPSGETILFEAVVIYEIKDLALLAGYTADPLNTIEDVTMGAVLSVMEGFNSWEEIRAASVRLPRARDTEFNRMLRDEVQRALASYGVNVLGVFLQNKAKCRVLKLVNSQEN
jgi:regulator of protease activity HflC (stomatin/prohibitin superfamily)